MRILPLLLWLSFPTGIAAAADVSVHPQPAYPQEPLRAKVSFELPSCGYAITDTAVAVNGSDVDLQVEIFATPGAVCPDISPPLESEVALGGFDEGGYQLHVTTTVGGTPDPSPRSVGFRVDPPRANWPAPEARPNLQFDMPADVLAAARQPDGGVVIAGRFTQINGRPHRYLARLTPAGVLDDEWNAAAAAPIVAVASAADGSVYAAVSVPNRVSFVKFTDGELDAAWTSAAVSIVSRSRGAIVVAEDGVYISGDLTVGNEPRRVVKLDRASGAEIAGWRAPAIAQGYVTQLIAHAGHLYIGGDFTTVGDVQQSWLARLSAADGALDGQWRPTLASAVETLAIDPAQSTLWAAGRFDCGPSCRGIARIPIAAGTVDTGFLAQVNGEVRALLPTPQGLYVAGRFRDANDVDAGMVRLKANGGLDATWPGRPGGAGSYRPNTNALAALGVQGAIVAGGEFSRIASAARLGAAVLDREGTPSAAVDATERMGRAAIASLAPAPDGAVIVGGYFAGANGHALPNLLRIRSDGSLDTEWQAGTDGDVAAVFVDWRGRIYAGGWFEYAAGAPATRVARFDVTGVLDADWNPAPDGIVAAIAQGPQEEIFLGGDFDNVDGLPRKAVARIDADGNVDAWQPQITGDAAALTLLGLPWGAVSVGGVIGTEPYSSGWLTRFDTSGMPQPEWTFEIGGSGVVALAMDRDGRMYAGGMFGNVGGVERKGIVRFLANGGIDGSWNAEADTSYIGAIVAGTDGVYVGGGFETLGGKTRAGLARLNYDDAHAANWSPDSDSYVHALALDERGTLTVGGEFTRIGGQVRSGIARIGDAALIFVDGMGD
jgi:hypothetical protein